MSELTANFVPGERRPTLRTFKFGPWTCVASFMSYGNGRPAILLRDARDGTPITTASVNLPDVPLTDGHVFVKDYSENEGVLAALVAAGIVEDTGERVRSGFVEIPVCRILSP